MAREFSVRGVIEPPMLDGYRAMTLRVSEGDSMLSVQLVPASRCSQANGVSGSDSPSPNRYHFLKTFFSGVKGWRDRQLPDGSIPRIPRRARIARRRRRRWRRWRRYEIPPRRYPISDIYPINPATPIWPPAAPIRSPISMPGPRYPRDVRPVRFGVRHTCAQAQRGESDHPSGRGYGDYFLKIHAAPPGAIT